MIHASKELQDLKIKKDEAVADSVFLDDSEEENDEAAVLERYQREPRIALFKWLIILILSVLLTRAGYLQIIKSGLYQNVAEGNSTRVVEIKSDRGIIYDSHFNPMVQNIASLDIVLTPSDLPVKEDDINQIIASLSDILQINKDELAKTIKSANKNSSAPILLQANIDHDKAIIVESKKEKLRGVSVEKNAIRQYADSIYFSPILGYSGKVSAEDLKAHPDYLMTDSAGKTGLEYFYESELRGQYGKENVEVDALGQPKRLIGKEDPTSGENLKLYLDADLQKKIYDEILQTTQHKLGGAGKKREEAPMAAAVAINPQNGGVLALVSMPAYDNNLFAKGISAADYQDLINNPNLPLLNRAIAGRYPPGSTFKPVMASAALNEGVITTSKIIDCPGYLNVGGYIFPDWKAHGRINIIDAIAESSDVFFYTVGGGYGDVTGLGIDRIKKYASLFGVTEKTGIDLPGETSGFIPDKEWKMQYKGEKWYLGDTYHASIGQGDVLATPLQIANYTAAIANGGKLYKPEIVDEMLDSANNVVKKIDPTVIRSGFIYPKNIKIVQEGMHATVTRGTGRSLTTLPVSSAGKTGTAQFGSDKKMHSWFTVYAPYENPEIALTVLVEGGGEGNELAVPIAKNVLEWYFNNKNKGI